MFLAIAKLTPGPIQTSNDIGAVYIAVPSYINQIKNCNIIRGISIFITLLSAIMLFINKLKINKLIEQKETEEKIAKIKKKIKIKWWISSISIAIIVITSIIIVYLKN